MGENILEFMPVKPFLFVFIMTLIMGPVIIPLLQKLKFGQTVRDDGPKTHLKKTGTPTMGGLIFLIPIIIATVIYASKYPKIALLGIITICFGIAGVIDDLIKIKKKSKDGLYWYQKMLILFIVSSAFVLWSMSAGYLNTNIIVPFIGIGYTLSLPTWFFVPFAVFVLLSITNAVNLTDGLDGLAAGITFIVMLFFTFVAMTRNNWDYLKIFSSMVSGGCLGFLVFNIHPAKVFMGDTGSLALGGAVGAVSILMGMPLILLIAGIIYVIETLSVILQVASFKIRGKRIFKMAPIHHHFELSGWKESKIVFTFWAITVISCALGFLSLRLKVF